jgi:hypothetical protein
MTYNKYLQNRPKKRNPTQKQPTDSPLVAGVCATARICHRTRDILAALQWIGHFKISSVDLVATEARAHGP